MKFEIMGLDENLEKINVLTYIADTAKKAMEKHLYYLNLSQKISAKIEESKNGYILDCGKVVYYVQNKLVD